MNVDAEVCEFGLQGGSGFGQAQREWRQGTLYKGRETNAQRNMKGK